MTAISALETLLSDFLDSFRRGILGSTHAGCCIAPASPSFPPDRRGLLFSYVCPSTLQRRVYVRRRGPGLLCERHRRAGRIQEGGDSRPLCVCEMLARDAKTPDERREPWSQSARGSRTSCGATGYGCWR